MGLPSKSYQILEMSRGKATIGHPWPTSSDLLLSMGIAGPGHKSFANMDACNCWHKYPMHMEASNCGYLDASHHGSKPLMRMDASHCGHTDVSYYGRKSLMHMASPNGGGKGASYHGHKSLMHMDAFNFGHTIASYHVYMSLMLMKPSYHHGEKSPMQTDAFCCGHTHTFYHGRKALMHIDAFIWGCPDAFRCGGRNSSLHTEASNCGHVHTVKSSVPLNNSTPQKILEDGAWEMMNLEEALASLEHKAHCVSVKDFIHILQMCRKKKKLEYAKRVHMHIRNHELEVHEVLGSYLVPTFVECGSVFDADQIFQRLTHRNEYSWTSLIQGYIECGECEHAFNLYHRMQKDGIHPNTYTFQSLLRACVQLKSINRGRDLHFDIAKEGLESHPFVGTALVDMYAKCGSVEEAREVFNELPARDVVVWTALIGGYAEHGLGEQALICLELMQGEGISPNSMTLVCSLKGCCSIGAIDRGREIHASIAIEGLEGDLFIGNALVDMYVKRDLLEDACEVFERMPDRDVVSWTSLIMGYAERGLGEETLVCLERMRQEWVSPNDVTYICSLKACGGSGAVDTGREVHTQVCKEGFERDAIVGNALVDMYAKCGSLSEAWEIFNKLRVRDLVSWSALIAGYARKGESKLAFSLFERMREEGIRPDGVVFLGVLNACSHAGLVLKGQDLFKAMSEEYALSPTVQHYNCMLDLLGRAGQLKAAVAWLDKMPFKPNFVTWSTLLGACQKWGNIELGRRAFDCAVRLDKKQITSFIVMSSIYADAHMWEDAKKIDAMRANIHVEEAGKDLD